MFNVHFKKIREVHTHIYTWLQKLYMVLSSNQSPVTSVIPCVMYGVHFFFPSFNVKPAKQPYISRITFCNSMSTALQAHTPAHSLFSQNRKNKCVTSKSTRLIAELCKVPWAYQIEKK